jgi:hypothetical protein
VGFKVQGAGLKIHDSEFRGSRVQDLERFRGGTQLSLSPEAVLLQLDREIILRGSQRFLGVLWDPKFRGNSLMRPPPPLRTLQQDYT